MGKPPFIRRKADPRMPVVIKKGMMTRAKGPNHHPLSIAMTDEYNDEQKWEEQEKYWAPHKLNRRHSLVDVTHIGIRHGQIVYFGKKVYTYPREQLSPLQQNQIDRLLERTPVKLSLADQVKGVLSPLLKDKSDNGRRKRAAVAIWRAYDQGYLKVPLEELTDEQLLRVWNFGPKSLEIFRTLIPGPSV